MWVWIALALVAGLVILGGIYAYQIRKLLNTIGSFQASLLLPSGSWRSGIAIFTRDAIQWHNFRTPKLGPDRVWMRAGLEFVTQPVSADGVQVIEFRYRGATEYLASTWQAIAAIVSWMDSAAPTEEPIF